MALWGLTCLNRRGGNAAHLEQPPWISLLSSPPSLLCTRLLPPLGLGVSSHPYLQVGELGESLFTPRVGTFVGSVPSVDAVGGRAQMGSSEQEVKTDLHGLMP